MQTKIRIYKTDQLPDISYCVKEDGRISYSLPFFVGEGELKPTFNSIEEFQEALRAVSDMLRRLVDKSCKLNRTNYLMSKRINYRKELFFINVREFTSACISVEVLPRSFPEESSKLTIEDLKIISTADFIRSFEEESFRNSKTNNTVFSGKASEDLIVDHYLDFQEVIVDDICFCRIDKKAYKRFCVVKNETPEEMLKRFIEGKDLRTLEKEIYKSCGITLCDYIAAQIYESVGAYPH